MSWEVLLLSLTQAQGLSWEPPGLASKLWGCGGDSELADLDSHFLSPTSSPCEPQLHFYGRAPPPGEV